MDVALEIQLAPNVGNVKMDPAHIEQIIINLFMNARDAIPGAGQITLQTCRMDSHVGLLIRDTGIGMTEEITKHIFEPFYTTKPVGKGTGLGLATVYGIVKQNQGDIRVESRVGEGTTFTILLPETFEESSTDQHASSLSMADSEKAKKTILVVDDEFIVRTAIVRALKKGGYLVLSAASAEEALAVSANHQGKIDLVLADVVLPGMNGQELAQRMLLADPKVPILYTSGYAESVIANHGILQPHIHFIEKPFTSQALIEKIRFVLMHPQTAPPSMASHE